MFNKLLNICNDNKYSNEKINHLFSIILRAWDEIKYMKAKKKNVDFKIEQMDEFLVEKINASIFLIIRETKIELTLNDLDKLADEIYGYFETKYPINYNYRDFDPIFVSLFLYEYIGKIKEIKFDNVYIDDFKLLRKNSDPVSLDFSESYKALISNDNRQIYTPFKSNHIIDNDYDRLNVSLNGIKKYKYPAFNKYIILYNDEPFIRDGQHRASVIKYLYGNIKVDVLRLYIDEVYVHD